MASPTLNAILQVLGAPKYTLQFQISSNKKIELRSNWQFYGAMCQQGGNNGDNPTPVQFIRAFLQLEIVIKS